MQMMMLLLLRMLLMMVMLTYFVLDNSFFKLIFWLQSCRGGVHLGALDRPPPWREAPSLTGG